VLEIHEYVSRSSEAPTSGKKTDVAEGDPSREIAMGRERWLKDDVT